MVYRLARHLNATAAGPLIPQSILTKPPSAELKPGQIDQDELPPYEQLDEVLHRYVERAQSVEEMVRAGLDEALVRRVVNMITAADYKRRQAPPTLKVTAWAFGSGRRVPIACKHELD